MTESRISPLDIGILTQVEYGKTHSLRSPVAFIIFINTMPISKLVDVQVLRLRRKELRLFTHPLTVVKNSVLYISGFVRKNQTTLIGFSYRYLYSYLRVIYRNYYVRAVSIPLVSLYSIGRLVPGPHRSLLDELDQDLLFISWWLMLGVLSSIGFGSGMHSGLLYLFPHLLVITTTSEKCNTLDFDTR
jgi:hypothetical protein